MTIVLNGTTGITNDGGYTGDGVVFADTTPANTLVTTTGGNVGVGTSSPGQKLVVANSAATYIQASNTSGTPSTIFLGAAGGENVIISRDGTTGNKLLAFYVGLDERARIDTNGNFRIGTAGYSASDNSRLFVSGTGTGPWDKRIITVEHTGADQPAIGFHAPSATSAGVFKYYGPGARFECRSGDDTTFVSISASAFNVSSDYRIKTEVTDFSNALQNVIALRPVNYKKDGSNAREYGLIAHEAAEHLPDLVRGEKDAVQSDGNMELQTIDYMGLTAVLTKAIQEQQAIITALTARVEALEGTQP